MVVSSRTKELRIIGEVRPLLSQLEAVESLAAKYRRKEKKDDEPSTSSLPSATIDDVIKSIRVEIHSITDIFCKLEIWEREMKGKIEDIAKVIDEALEVSNSENELHSKLLTVKENASGFKGSLITTNDSPLRLERLEEFVNSVSHSTEPLAYYSSPPSASTDHVDHQYGELQFDTTKSVADFEEHIKSVSLDLRREHGPSSLLQHLSRNILLFLSILPAGSLIKKTTIHNYCSEPWMFGMYYNPERLNESITMILKYLRRRGIIEFIYKDYKPWDIDSCMINPLARKALINLAASEKGFRSYAQLTIDPLTLRSCLLPEQNEEERRQRPTHYLEYARYLEYVRCLEYCYRRRTCVNVNHRYLKFSRNKFEEMKHLCAALMLGRCHNSAKHHHIEIENMEFINWLASFEGLQRLSLRGISRITELPSSIGNIPRLLFLDLRACYDLQRLPVELTWLKSLEHLDVSECYFLTHMPKGMESLTKLRVLKGFKVGSPQILDSCQLDELSKLYLLKKLSINVARDSMLDEEQFDKLSCLTSLVSLTITWSTNASTSRNAANSTSSSSMVLTVNEMDISPPPNLEKLDIRCIPQSTKPQWLDASKLSKLKRLYIRGGNMNLQSICVSGLTWTSVQVIRLRFLQGVNLEEAELHNAFPALDYLEIHKCNDSKFDYRWQSPRLEEEAKR